MTQPPEGPTATGSRLRGSGRTTRQLLDAKQEALFITMNPDYTRDLARKLDRPDINIRSLWWLRLRRWQGQRFSQIVVDHDTERHLDPHDHFILSMLNKEVSA